eukprot:14949352-Alexandrium_andersonii.AAC.1
MPHNASLQCIAASLHEAVEAARGRRRLGERHGEGCRLSASHDGVAQWFEVQGHEAGLGPVIHLGGYARHLGL